MNNSQNAPSLERASEPTLPSRLLHSPYFVLRTPIGGYYLDAEYNQNMVRRPESLAQFLAEAQRVQSPSCEMGEVKYTARKNQQPLRYLHEGAIKEFEEAAVRFLKTAPTSDHAALRAAFRLPDPAREPDAYWVSGERFAPQLMILWGCEKEQNSSLPLTGQGRTVCSELRARAMSWLRLFRDGIELSRFAADGQSLDQDARSLGAFLAFPVLDATGKVTHLDHLVKGQYVRTRVSEKRMDFSKARPLTQLPGSEVERFAAAAREFYRVAHPSGCVCAACAGKPASSAASKKPGVLSYQQELRQGFRLPDPDARPDAYYVVGAPQSCKLLALCPHPGVKDAEDIEQNRKHVEWQEKKARTAEDKERAQKARQQYNVDLGQHNLYKRFFYSKEECLCLTSDTVLGLPVASTAAANTGAMSLLSPTVAPVTAASTDAQTVEAKLMKRRINWTKIMVMAGSAVGLILALLIAAIVMWPHHLDPISVAVSNSTILDPSNARNFFVVEYNNRLGSGLMASKPSTDSMGHYVLLQNGRKVNISEPKLYPNSQKAVFMKMEDAGNCFEDGGTNFQVKIENAHDIWGNRLTNTAQVVFTDKRPPSLRGNITTFLSDNNDMIQVDFDEPMNLASAQNASFYSISGQGVSAITNAVLQKNRTSVLLQADKAFQSSTEYHVILSSNLVDMAHAPNHLKQVSTAFTYAMIPLAVTRIDASESQTRVRVEFNKFVDVSATTNAFKIDKLQIGEINVADAKTIELGLTNSAMLLATPYVLQIQRLKDSGSGTGGELTTNLTFTYTGSPDINPPRVQGDPATEAAKIILNFSKPLRRDIAQKPAIYTLTSQGQALPIVITRAVLERDTKVQLLLPSDLEKGDYTLKITGIEDLYGNKATNTVVFKKRGIRTQIESIKALQIEGDLIRIRLAAGGQRIDVNRLTDNNFQLEDLEGKPVNIALALDNNPSADENNVVDISLKATPAPSAAGRYQLHCKELKLVGDSDLKETIVKAPAASSKNL